VGWRSGGSAADPLAEVRAALAALVS
jgi:hypothetical protein